MKCTTESKLAIKRLLPISTYIEKKGEKCQKYMPCPACKSERATCAINADSFYCMKCLEGGDIFRYIMLDEDMGFMEAYHQAQKALGNVPLSSFPSRRTKKSPQVEFDERYDHTLQMEALILNHLPKGISESCAGIFAHTSTSPTSIALDLLELPDNDDGWQRARGHIKHCLAKLKKTPTTA